MCNFIGWSTCDSNCSSWGNYANVLGAKYTGYHSTDTKSDWVTNTITKGTTNNRFIFSTGKFVNSNNGTTMKKNIYDIAGNVWELTTEVPKYSDSNCVLRGGSAYYAGSSTLATYRIGDTPRTSQTSAGVGFRIVLYVK